MFETQWKIEAIRQQDHSQRAQNFQDLRPILEDCQKMRKKRNEKVDDLSWYVKKVRSDNPQVVFQEVSQPSARKLASGTGFKILQRYSVLLKFVTFNIATRVFSLMVTIETLNDLLSQSLGSKTPAEEVKINQRLKHDPKAKIIKDIMMTYIFEEFLVRSKANSYSSEISVKDLRMAGVVEKVGDRQALRYGDGVMDRDGEGAKREVIPLLTSFR
ncbi:hypothetical protein BY996DRAFT_6467583 [Phakopsora pachyrhizi]|nr:hypothetical protein BY996DRAFT_6467583 [Phakopsora pachyrhizi]